MANNVVKYILDVNTKDAQDGLKKTSRETKKLESNLDDTKRSALDMASKVGSAVTGISSALGLVAGAVSTVVSAFEDAIEGAFEFNRAVVDSINDLNDLNAQSALSAESIQAVKVAFEGSGQSAQAAGAFISRFPRLMADLEAGSSRASEAAAKLGISIRNQAGEMRSSDEILKDAIASLQQIENDTERSTTAFLLFGRSAGQLLQAFAKTSNFENFLALSNEFGVKTGPEASAAAAKFQELLAALNVVAAGTKQAFVEALGGIAFFNEILLGTVKLLATTQVFLQDQQENIQSFSNALGAIGTASFELFRSLLGSVQEYIGEAVNFMVIKLALPIYILNQIGLISDETFSKVEDLATATRDAGFALEDLTVAANSNVEQAQSTADRIEELVQGILAGIDLEGKNLQDGLKGLEDGLKSTTAAVDEFTFSFQGEDEAALERLNRAMMTIDDAFKEFQPLTVAAEQATEQVRLLQDAVEYYEELGLDTELAQELLTAAREKEKEALEALKPVVEDVSTDFQKLGESIAGTISGISDPSSLIGGLGGATGKAGAALSGLGGKAGQAGAALTAAAPFVGAIGAAVVALEKLGQNTPKDLEETFDTFVKNFKNGARILPTLIADILPDFLAEISVAITAATINLLFQLPKAITDALIQFTITFIIELKNALFGWADRIQDFFKNIGEYFNNLLTREGRRENRQRILGFESGGRFTGQSGLRFTGADEGLAMLHRGETVVQESNRRSQAVDRTMGSMGSGINIVVNAQIVEQSAIDELVRKIEQRMTGFGCGRSTLFGV